MHPTVQAPDPGPRTPGPVGAPTGGSTAGRTPTTRRLQVRRAPRPRPEPWSPRLLMAGREREPAPTRDGTLPLFALRDRGPVPATEAPVPTSAEDLPEAEDVARRLVQATVDVLRGHRPASQLLRWTTPEVYAELRERARLEHALAARRASAARGAGAVAAPGGRRPVLRSLRAQRVADHAYEVGAVVLDDRRARAVAARLEGLDGRWRLTALQVG